MCVFVCRPIPCFASHIRRVIAYNDRALVANRILLLTTNKAADTVNTAVQYFCSSSGSRWGTSMCCTLSWVLLVCYVQGVTL
jgi:hypothetical protein